MPAVRHKAINQSEYSATLSQAEIYAILAGAVAHAAGIDLAAANVRVDTCYIHAVDRCGQPTKEAEIRLIVEHGAPAGAEAQS